MHVGMKKIGLDCLMIKSFRLAEVKTRSLEKIIIILLQALMGIICDVKRDTYQLRMTFKQFAK